MVLYTIVPCYNEEDVLPETFKRLHNKYEQLYLNKIISLNSRIVFVNDGSKDNTWNLICILLLVL